ncbi:MAG: Bax inhibitor-1 family protein, partial [Alphaproteobacteria bacterium]|nr:Bax inhibitor-1 family protein [Alphaproteobacteria bacterium]
FMGLIGIIIAMVVNLFIRSGTASLAISVLAVLIFAGLTAYDTQRIRNSYNERAPAEVQNSLAVWGALALYLNFINLFFHLLRLLGNRQ